MPDKHALLSASSSDRWIHCPPSARLEERVAEKPSSYAAEGTEAHSIAEQKLNNWKDGHPRKNVACPNGEMDEATTYYRDYVVEAFNAEKKQDDAAGLFVEVQVDLSSWIPEGFGTSDAVIVSNKTLHVIDFKYGTGVPVSAIRNSQLMLYAAGAMAKYDVLYDFKNVTVHIVQPRLDSVSDYTLTVDELKNWLENTVKPAARLAWNGAGVPTPGRWCRFCKVKARCKERAKHNIYTAESHQEIANNLLTDEDITSLLPRLDEIQRWAKDVQTYALDQALQGHRFNGYKVVEGVSRRKITNEPEAMQRLQTAGYSYTDITQTKLKSITELEKLTGKKAFAEIVGDACQKPPGAPTLVPESDKRPSIMEKNLEVFSDL